MKAMLPGVGAILLTLLGLLPAEPAYGQVRPDRHAAGLAWEVYGDGEPILFIHGSFMEDALRPVIDQPALESFQRIHYDRAGYGESAPRGEAFSFARGATDALALIEELGVGSAHVVGYSLGGVIALELARQAPEAVKSLVLIEPPLPLAGLSEGPPPQFLVDGMELWQAGDHAGATDVFFSAVASPEWRGDIARTLPRGAEQVSRNAHLFFDQELPAFEGYLIAREDVAGVDQPLLYVVSESMSGYGEAHHDRLKLIESWLPHTQTLVIPDADHALPLQRPERLARGISSFLTGSAATTPP